MSVENFELIDHKGIDSSFIKRFLKIYHQQGATLDNSDQNVEFIFGEINNNQICNAYLQ